MSGFRHKADIAPVCELLQLRGMNLWPLLIGMLCLFVTGRALVIGSASVDGQGFQREDEPMLYWSIVLAGLLIACFLFYLALGR